MDVSNVKEILAMRRLTLTFLVLLFVATSVNAAITVYTDRTAWESAVGAYMQESFEDATLNPGVSVVSSNGFVDTTNQWWWDVVDEGETTTWSFNAPIIGWGGYWDLTENDPGSGTLEPLRT